MLTNTSLDNPWIAVSFMAEALQGIYRFNFNLSWHSDREKNIVWHSNKENNQDKRRGNLLLETIYNTGKNIYLKNKK
jgi:hypothetical protein